MIVSMFIILLFTGPYATQWSAQHATIPHHHDVRITAWIIRMPACLMSSLYESAVAVRGIADTTRQASNN